MIRILIADDHPIVRRGLTDIVGGEADMRVVGEAQNTLELLDVARQQPADVVVLDITMPGPSGLEALRRLKQEQPSLRVLILSMHPERQYAARVIKAGAAGYVTKDTAAEELVTAIRKVMASGHYVSPAFAERAAIGLIKDDAQSMPDRLSDREYEVLRLLVSGRLVSEIADELCISIKTASSHKQRAMEKLGIRSVAGLSRYAVEHDVFV
jgi:two-component system, NarL family, invasion response regulator UvrY